MRELGYYNGEWGPLEQMRVPMCDRVCWFGDGVYDAQLARNGRIFAIQEHVDRLFRSAAELDITIPLGKAELVDVLYRLLPEMDDDELMVYYQVTRGTQVRLHSYGEGMQGNLWVMLKPVKAKLGGTLTDLITCEDIRFHRCDIKTLNLIPAVQAAQAAERAGAYEAVLYRPGGRVTECAHSNVHILKDGTLLTAPADELILAGISRAHLIRACEALGVPVREEPFTVDELMDADEVLTTSSSAFLLRAAHVDGTPVGGRAVALYERLRDHLNDEFLRETAPDAPCPNPYR